MLVEQVAQTARGASARRRSGEAGGSVRITPAVERPTSLLPRADHDAEARVRQAGIDAEDHHRSRILRGGPDAFLVGDRLRRSPCVHALSTNLHPADGSPCSCGANRDDAAPGARTMPVPACAGLEAELTDRARIDPVCGVLTRDAFRGDADAVLAPRGALRAAARAGARRHRRLPRAERAPGPAAGDAALAGVAERLRDLTRAHRRPGPHRRRRGRRPHARHHPRRRTPVLRAPDRRSSSPRPGTVTVSAGLAAAARRHHPRRPARRRRPRRSTAPAVPAAAAPSCPCGRRRRPPEPDAQLHVIDALANTLARARPLHRRARRGRRRARPRGRRGARARGATRSSASPTPRCCTTSARSAIPDHVLHKPGPLDDEEWELMREHPVIGERILRAVPGMGRVARIVRHEHERCDGGGLPRRPARRGDPASAAASSWPATPTTR